MKIINNGCQAMYPDVCTVAVTGKGQLKKMCLAFDQAILLSRVGPRKIITYV